MAFAPVWLRETFLLTEAHKRERDSAEVRGRKDEEERRKTGKGQRYALIANAEAVIILYRTVTHVPFPTGGRERSES